MRVGTTKQRLIRYKNINCIDLGAISYESALVIQQKNFKLRQNNLAADMLIICEHPHCYTAGTDKKRNTVLDKSIKPVITDRGGGVTYHGPGQIVAYPIIQFENNDVILYLRTLEKVIIELLRGLGVEGERHRKFTGVWTGGKKIGFIGVKSRDNFFMHGLSVNISCDLKKFSAIIPCGIGGLKVTSVLGETGMLYSYETAAGLMKKAFCGVFGFKQERSQDNKETRLAEGSSEIQRGVHIY